MRSVVIATLAFAALTPSIANAGTIVERWVAAHGGCKNAFTELKSFPRDIHSEFLGLPGAEWTDSLIADYQTNYAKCYAITFTPEGITPNPQNINVLRFTQDQVDQLRIRFVEPARNAKQRDEEQQVATAQLAKEKAERDRKQLIASIADAKAQADRDREAADQAAKLAETEEPQVLEAQKQLAAAESAKQAAEKRLADVRGRIADATTRAQADDRQTSNNLKIAAAEQQSALKQSEHNALQKDCALDQRKFEKIAMGMALTDVDLALGCRGKQVSVTQVPGFGKMSIYSWSDTPHGAEIIGNFSNERLQSKLQNGID